MARLAVVVAAAAPQAPAQDAPARRYRSGELTEEQKKKVRAEASGRTLRDRRDPKKAAALAAGRRRARLERLERDFGVYDVATLVDNGDVSQRVDVVLISAGFPKSQADKVNTLADSFKSALLKVDPFRNYPAYINIHRVNVDDASLALAHVPVEVGEIIAADFDKARAYGALAPDCELAVVFCNITKVRSTGGGSPGRTGVITIDSDLDLGRTFLHEMGHAFTFLSDEYVDETRRRELEEEGNPWAVNFSKVSDPRRVKWHYWVHDVWRTAHQDNRLPKGRRVGCYEGAALCPKGVYRPEEECLMRYGETYCVVCFEHVEKRFYSLIAPINDARPRRDVLPLWLDESVTLEADAIRTVGGKEQFGKFEGLWYVDGKEQKATRAKDLTTTLTLQAKMLGAGVHEAALRVDFCNHRVRRDHGWLSSSQAWTLDVGAHARPSFKPVPAVAAKLGVPVVFETAVNNPDPAAYRVEGADLPPGASFQKGRFAWTPAKEHQGAWRPRFILTDGKRAVETAVDIAVADPAEKNFPPDLPAFEPLSVGEGETLEFPLDVVEVDGDNLVHAAAGLPEGASLGVYDGILRWTPGPRQAGRYEKIAVEVTDGGHRAKGTLTVIVEDRATGDGAKGVPLAQALRWPLAEMRREALKHLGAAPPAFRLLEAARLLRDADAGVRAAALAHLREILAADAGARRPMLIRDLAPHAWHFTDDPDALAWLDELAGKGETVETKPLRAALKAVEKYNRDRGAGGSRQ